MPDLARMLAELERRLVDVERRAQMGNSSVATPVLDESGEVVDEVEVDVASALTSGAEAAETVAVMADDLTEFGIAVSDAQAVADGAAEDAATALASANGKNRIFHAVTDPDQPGSADGDTWFKHDVSNVVVGQWRWDGTDWLLQEISGEVIASLDAGKITTGELVGIILTGTLVRSRDTGKRWELLGNDDVTTLRAFSGVAGESAPGGLDIASAEISGGDFSVNLYSPKHGTKRIASVDLQGQTPEGLASASTSAQVVHLTADPIGLTDPSMARVDISALPAGGAGQSSAIGVYSGATGADHLVSVTTPGSVYLDAPQGTDLHGAVAAHDGLDVTGALAAHGALTVTGALSAGEVTATGDIRNRHTTGATTRVRSPGAKVRRTGNTTVAHSTYTTVPWDANFNAANVDPTVWDGVADKSRLYAPVTGRYLVSGVVVFATNTVGWRIVALAKNGTRVDFVSAAPVSGTASCVPFSWPEVYLAAGEYIEIQCNHGTGTGTTLAVGTAGGIDSTCSLSYIGPV